MFKAKCNAWNETSKENRKINKNRTSQLAWLNKICGSFSKYKICKKVPSGVVSLNRKVKLHDDRDCVLFNLKPNININHLR